MNTQPDLSDLDDTTKRVHVKPLADGQWGVFELTDLESYFDDLERYGERVANANLWFLRQSRGFVKYRSVHVGED